jgi:hypothetical protein
MLKIWRMIQEIGLNGKKYRYFRNEGYFIENKGKIYRYGSQKLRRTMGRGTITVKSALIFHFLYGFLEIAVFSPLIFPLPF